ncbi:hypothetical protein Tsubulata_043732, partial [Turnera subulata]
MGISYQHSDLTASLDIVPVEESSADDESFRAPVTIDLEPREPAPGLVDHRAGDFPIERRQRREPLISSVKDGGVIENVVWKVTASDSFADPSSNTAFGRGPLHLTYIDDEDERKEQANLSRNMGYLL